MVGTEAVCDLGNLVAFADVEVSFTQEATNSLLPGQSGFPYLIGTPNLLAIDKTKYIEVLDVEPHYQYMFLRPRRWGKSTFLQMLINYYDKSKAAEFQDTFGQLYIGKNPTPDRSRLLVLLLNFSTICAAGTLQDLRRDFNNVMNDTLEQFLMTNAKFLGHPDPATLLMENDGSRSLQRVLVIVYQFRLVQKLTNRPILAPHSVEKRATLHWS